MNRQTSWVVALTGGVAAGKSVVAERFQALGVKVYDADTAAREVVAPGTSGLKAIVRAFGETVLQADGTLDRSAVRKRVFDDKQARMTLESIVHPAVSHWLEQQVRTDDGRYCMLAIPLLAETWPKYNWVNRVLVVDAPDAVRIERLMRRDDIDEKLARSMLAAQATRKRRLELADDVIDNSGAPQALDHAVIELHQRYLALVAQV